MLKMECQHPAIAPKGRLSDHRCIACGEKVDFVAWVERVTTATLSERT